MAKVQAQEPFRIFSGEKVIAVLNVEGRPTQKGQPSVNISCVVVEDRAATVPANSKGNAGMLVFENYMLSGRAIFKLEQLFGAAKLPSGKDTDDADFVDWLRNRLTADGIYLLAEIGEEAKWNDPTKKVAKIQRLRGLAFPGFTPDQALAYMDACDKAKADNTEPPVPPKAVADSKANKWPDIVNRALEKMEENAKKQGGNRQGAAAAETTSGEAKRARSDDPMEGGGGSFADDDIPFS